MRTWKVGALASLLLLVFATPALATTVRATPKIQGAGKVVGNHAGYSCQNDNQNDNVTKTDCGQSVKVEDWHPFNVGMSFTAETIGPTGRWDFIEWQGCQSTSDNGLTCNVQAACCGSADWFPRAIFDDADNPTITSGPTEDFLNQERTVRMWFGADEGDSTYTCRFDAAQFQTCTSPRQFTLEPGERTFQVQAWDPSGNGSNVVSRTIRVIDTVLNAAGPSGLTNSRTASFGFTTQGGTGFECSLNFGAWTDCSSGFVTYSSLADNNYTFRVRGKAAGGWYDRVPAVRDFTVDGTPPETTLNPLLGPGEGALVTVITAQFGFTANETSTFECKLDGLGFEGCLSPRNLTALASGSHKFQVRAKDQAGNYDPTPAERNWTVAAPDADTDGYTADVDCNDGNATVNPGRPEIPDNDVDENCDGVKGVNLDRDDDGFARPGDCDDGNASINPGRPEILDNDVDENCDGVKGVNMDRDGDGAQRGEADCDDGNPAIRKGAVDVPGNGIDEDCSGADATKVLSFTLSYSYSKLGSKATKFTTMVAKGVPAGATLSVTCKAKKKKGPKCPKPFALANAGGNVKLKGFDKANLPVGAKLVVRVTEPNAVGFAKVVEIVKLKKPKVSDRCMLPNTTKLLAAC
jgi:Putative metal-binding motif